MKNKKIKKSGLILLDYLLLGCRQLAWLVCEVGQCGWGGFWWASFDNNAQPQPQLGSVDIGFGFDNKCTLPLKEQVILTKPLSTGCLPGTDQKYQLITLSILHFVIWLLK